MGSCDDNPRGRSYSNSDHDGHDRIIYGRTDGNTDCQPDRVLSHST